MIYNNYMVGQEINDVRMSTMLKIFTLLGGIGLAALAIYKFTAIGILNPRDFFLTIYYIIFGIMIALSEMPCKSMMSCFSFLGFYIGKAVFCIFLGTITFNPGSVWFIIISIVFWAVGILYLILACTCKGKLVNKEEEEGEKPKEGEQGGFKPVALTVSVGNAKS